MKHFSSLLTFKTLPMILNVFLQELLHKLFRIPLTEKNTFEFVVLYDIIILCAIIKYNKIVDIYNILIQGWVCLKSSFSGNCCIYDFIHYIAAAV